MCSLKEGICKGSQQIMVRSVFALPDKILTIIKRGFLKENKKILKISLICNGMSLNDYQYYAVTMVLPGTKDIPRVFWDNLWNHVPLPIQISKNTFLKYESLGKRIVQLTDWLFCWQWLEWSLMEGKIWNSVFLKVLGQEPQPHQRVGGAKSVLHYL